MRQSEIPVRLNMAGLDLQDFGKAAQSIFEAPCAKMVERILEFVSSLEELVERDALGFPDA